MNDIIIIKSLGIINILLFIMVMLFIKKNNNESFIKLILLTFPFMGIKIISEFSVFDIITIIFIIFFYKPKGNVGYIKRLYYTIFLILFLSITIGLLISNTKIDADNISEYISIINIFFFSKLIIEECIYKIDFVEKIIKYLKIMLLVSFIFLLCQMIFGVQISLSIIQNPNIVSSEGIRYPSFLSDPQVYSQYLAALSFLCLIHEKFNRNKTINYILLISCITGIMIAGGRAGFIGVIAGFIIVLIFSKIKIKFIIFFLALIVVTLIIQFQDYLMIFKRGTDMNDAYDLRYSIWLDAMIIFIQQPIVGIGIGNYAKYVTIHNPDQVWLRNNEYIPFDHPESGYLKILTETGAIGFICFMILIIYPLIKGIHQYLISKNDTLLYLVASITSWFFGFYTTYSLGDTRFKIIIVTIISLLISKISWKNENILVTNKLIQYE